MALRLKKILLCARHWAGHPSHLTSPMPSSRRLSEPTPALCARWKLSQQLVCPPQMSITREIWWLGCQPLKILDTSLQFVLSVECPPCPLSFGSWEEVRSVSFGSPSRRPPILKHVFFSQMLLSASIPCFLWKLKLREGFSALLAT